MIYPTFMPTKWTFIETIRMKPLHLLNCKTELYRSSVLIFLEG